MFVLQRHEPCVHGNPHHEPSSKLSLSSGRLVAGQRFVLQLADSESTEELAAAVQAGSVLELGSFRDFERVSKGKGSQKPSFSQARHLFRS